MHLHSYFAATLPLSRRTLTAVGLLTLGVFGACGREEILSAGGSGGSRDLGPGVSEGSAAGGSGGSGVGAFGGSGGSETGGSGGSVNAGGGLTPSDSGFMTSFACPALPDGGFLSTGNGENAASGGSLTGSTVNCSICDVGAVLAITTVSDDNPSTLMLLHVSNAANGDSCTVPGDASNVSFGASIVLKAIAPGVYSSSQSNTSNECANITLDYSLPITVDCSDAGRGPDCPPGCPISLCTEGDASHDEGGEVLCTPCQGAGAPEVFYTAEGPCDAAPSVGSWEVTLTSVVPYAGDAGLPSGTVSYIAHGSLTATLVAAKGETATLSMTF
jgi:hypothetical protein